MAGRPAYNRDAAVPAVAAVTVMNPPTFAILPALWLLCISRPRTRGGPSQAKLFLNLDLPYITKRRIRPAMAINGHRNKLIGPGGGTRRLHPRGQFSVISNQANPAFLITEY